jgi:hypothetical protein
MFLRLYLLDGLLLGEMLAMIRSTRFAAIVMVLVLAILSGCSDGKKTDSGNANLGGGGNTIVATVSGIIRDCVNGQPIANAEIELVASSRTRSSLPKVATDLLGRFSILNVPRGEYVAHCTKLNQSHKVVDVATSVVDKIKALSVTMVPSSVTTPTIIDVAWPPPGIRVGQTAPFSGSATSGGQSLTVFWTVQPLVAGGAIIGTVSADGLFTATTTGVGIVQAQIGPTTATAQITVKDNTSAGGITGIATDSSGRPVAGASVAAAGSQVTSAQDGTFSFADVAPGTYTVAAGSGSALAVVVVNSVAVVQVQAQ